MHKPSDKKPSPSGLRHVGVAPNVLIGHVENTVPFLFQGEIDSQGEPKKYLARLQFYKKNLKNLHKINLADYFYLCMSAHWATAGTFVPTNVDNQIRESLWRHETIGSFIELMAKTTMESWQWDYQDVTNRKAYNRQNNQMLSTHEGTWLSVAIGAYCALNQHARPKLAQQMAELILQEVEKEEKLLRQLLEDGDHINFLRTCALMAHNFGDLDRVMDQWQMDSADSFHQRIYKLGHRPNPAYSNIFVKAGQINKELLAVENHRHMSLRAPRCLRRSKDFLVPVGPFMDGWGEILGKHPKLHDEERAEIIAALYEGFTRQDRAQGYARALSGMLNTMPTGLEQLERYIPVDLMRTLKNSPMMSLAKIGREEFEVSFTAKLLPLLN